MPGNHDKETRKLTDAFSWLNNLAEISVPGQPHRGLPLCHAGLESFQPRGVAFVRAFSWDIVPYPLIAKTLIKGISLLLLIVTVSSNEAQHILI